MTECRERLGAVSQYDGGIVASMWLVKWLIFLYNLIGSGSFFRATY